MNKLVILVNNTRNLDYHTNMKNDMLGFLTDWAQQKFDYELEIGDMPELTYHTGPLSLLSLRTLKLVVWPKADNIIVMGPKKIGDWMGVYAPEMGIIYGYYYYHRFWKNLNKAITWSISHELSHYILHQQKKEAKTWIDKVHLHDQLRLKDRMKWKDKTYLTVGGEY